jgi:hypothetical protein
MTKDRQTHRREDDDEERLKVPFSFTETLRGILKVKPPKPEGEDGAEDRDVEDGEDAER